MARYTKGALGAFSGKLGNVVGSNWREIDYLRSLPRPSKKPASPLQLAQRAKFALTISFLSTIKDVLNIGFGDKKLGKSSGYNQAVKSMLHDGIIGTYPDYEIDFEKVIMSKGSLSGLFGLSIVEGNPMELELSWVLYENQYSAFGDDDVVIVLYNETKKLFTIYEESKREDMAFNILMPEVFAGDEIFAWVFLVNRDGETNSNSQFAGSVILTA